MRSIAGVSRMTFVRAGGRRRRWQALGASGVTPATWNRPTAPLEAAAAASAFKRSSRRVARQAVDDADGAADLRAVPAAQHRIEDVGGLQRRRNAPRYRPATVARRFSGKWRP